MSSRRDNFRDFRGRSYEEPETGPADERPTNLVSPALIEHLRSKFPDCIPELAIDRSAAEVSSLVRYKQGQQSIINYLDNLVRRD